MTQTSQPNFEHNVAVRFHVTCDSTKPGQIVKIIGSIPIIGSWSASNALSMHTDEDSWPVWKAGALIDLQLLRKLNTRSIEYKYILVDGASPPEFQWETTVGNRIIFMDAYSVG